MTELIEGDEFDEMVPESCKPLKPQDQLAKMLNQSKIVLLLNGTVEKPLDEASKALLDKVNALKCEYSIIDMSVKSEFVEHLGKNVQVPFVYMDGKAACDINGLDQLAEQEVFKVGLKQRKLTVNERIEELLKGSKVLLFMKGSPDSPQCGFSQKTIGILKKYDGLKYDHFDILQDNEIREGLKKYSNWPTYPQLYVKGDLIGGIDIIQEMDEENELEDALTVE